MQQLARVLTDVKIFMWKLRTLERSPTNVALNHVLNGRIRVEVTVVKVKYKVVPT